MIIAEIINFILMAKNRDRIRKSNGQWSIPGGVAVPGQLSVDYENGTILLEIYSPNDIEGNNADILFNSITASRNYYVDFIWGFAGELGNVTLYQCTWSSSEGLGVGLFINRYTVEFLFNHIHLNKNFKLRSAKLCFPYLGGFYFGFHRLDLPEEGSKNEIPEEYHTSKLLINEQLNLNIRSRIIERLENLFTKKRIQIEDHALFEYNEDVPFQRLMVDAFNFKRLLEFSYGQTLPFQLQLIFPDSATLDVEPNNHIVHYEFRKEGFSVINFSLNQAKEIPMGTLNQNEMLLSRWTIGLDELELLVQRWFRQTRMKNIVEYYLETVNEYGGEPQKLTSVMMNNRFLNLIQGLEDYYREILEPETVKKDREDFESKKRTILADIKKPDLKQWLNNTFKFTRYNSLEDKLQAVVDHCRPMLEKVFKPLDWSQFPTAAKDLRHTLSHGMNKSSFLGAELYLNYYMARLLIVICLMDSLQVNPLYHNAMLRNNYLFNELFGQIITRQKAIAQKAASN